jgi:2OG-Fe(II) oxygenase superfamily
MRRYLFKKRIMDVASRGNKIKFARMLDLLHPSVVGRRSDLAAQFQGAHPFPHVVIDPLLEATFCDDLLRAFPPFDRGQSVNEFYYRGDKAVVEDVLSLGPAYQRFDALMRAPPFLELLSDVTGIPNLLYDPDYSGGGTHENRSGEELDPHIDFNIHPRTNWYRCLNLLLYLNPEWDERWGGALELYENPSRHERLTRVVPTFNKCVLFETSERSWHGFQPIAGLPGGDKRSRRSIAVYFYVERRVPRKQAPQHSTVYVDRPITEELRLGAPLTPALRGDLMRAVERRRQRLEGLFEREKALLSAASKRVEGLLQDSEAVDEELLATVTWLAARTDEHLAYVAEREPLLNAILDGKMREGVRVPLTSRLRDASGLGEDGRAGTSVRFAFDSIVPIERLILRGRVDARQRLVLEIGGSKHETEVGPGRFEWIVPAVVRLHATAEVTIATTAEWKFEELHAE